jgi:transcriptional regulator of arginine metabolism
MPSDPEIRDQRQQAILEILGEYAVSTQGELVAYLKARGITATQSSVSRDLQTLGIWRRGRHYVLPNEEQEVDEPLSAELDEAVIFLRSAKPAGAHMTVIHTLVGAAQTVAAAIDSAGWPEVVGTMAGDDTIFIATADAEGQQQLLRRIEKILEER